MKISVKYFICILVLFIYMYIPPLFPKGTIIIFSFIFLIMWMCSGEIIKKREFHLILSVLILLNAWSAFNYFFAYETISGMISYLSSEIYILTFTIGGMLAIVFLINKYKLSRQETWKLIICSGMVQTILSLVARIYNPFQTLMCHFLVNIMSAEDIAWWRNWRLYGLSASLTYGMPITQALVGGLCFLYAEKYDAKYFIWVPFIWLSGIINARVALVVIAVEMLVWFVFKVINFQGKMKRSICIFSGVIFLVLGVVIAFALNGIINLSRITDPIEEILSLLGGHATFKTQGYLAYLFADKKAFDIPRGIQLILGGGIKNNTSDIGYVRNLWSGGIIYSAFIYIFYLKLVQKWESLYNRQQLIERMIPKIFGLTLFIVNIKGDAFCGISEFLNLFYLGIGISIWSIQEKNSNE